MKLKIMLLAVASLLVATSRDFHILTSIIRACFYEYEDFRVVYDLRSGQLFKTPLILHLPFIAGVVLFVGLAVASLCKRLGGKSSPK